MNKSKNIFIITILFMQTLVLSSCSELMMDLSTDTQTEENKPVTRGPQYRRSTAENLYKAMHATQIKGIYGKKNYVSYAFDKIRRARNYTSNTRNAKKSIYKAVQFLGKRKFNSYKADRQIKKALIALMNDGVKCIEKNGKNLTFIDECKRQ
ncbi:MAG: hypothetical protein GY793_12260 [Proteobacteria bacterium]|nr:hypothetical protein [Pseudomonadota bacterium]